MANTKMNYIFFFPDELRADALHCYGNKITKTPNFDTLCTEGVKFEQCHVQNPVCSPSRCSLFTGRYPHSNGHRSLWNLLKENEHNLFSYLKDDGYDVRIYGKNDVFSASAAPDFVDEFTTQDDSSNTPIRPIKSYGEQGYFNFLYHATDSAIEDTADFKSITKGIEFLSKWKSGDKPFMLFLPLMYPHCPYTAPEPYYSMYFDYIDDFQIKPIVKTKPLYHELIRKYRNLNFEDSKRISAVYSGMVSYTDMLLGQIMNCMEACDLEKNSALIVAADHGDYAGDYGLVEKWPNGCEDVLTHVPLIIKTPNCKKGHNVKECVELFDIMPTILELSNIELKHQHYAVSLIPQLLGAPGDYNRTVYCEGGYNPCEFQCNEGAEKPSTEWTKNNPTSIYYPKYLQQKEHPESVSRTVMARTLEYKYIRRYSKDNELYDLYNDPDELHNLYNNSHYSEIQREFELKILDWYIETADAVPYEEDNRLIQPITLVH